MCGLGFGFLVGWWICMEVCDPSGAQEDQSQADVSKAKQPTAHTPTDQCPPRPNRIRWWGLQL